MRIAAIDVGSNSIHMVVVETDEVGNQRVLAREKVMVRLSRGMAHTGQIAPENYQAGMDALNLMGQVIQSFQCDTVVACGTAALREAANAQAFLAGAAAHGVPIRVISGEEEARLIHLAVSRAVPFPEEPIALVDIGGGSTEITWTLGDRVLASISLPWGIQRLADAAPTSDPPTPEDLKHLRRFMAKVLKKARKGLPEGLPNCRMLLATSGTWQDLAKGCGSETELSLGDLIKYKRRLWQLSSQERMSLLGVEAKRAEVLHVGATWAAGLMRWLGASQARCLAVGLREGMIWEALKHGGQNPPALAARRRASVEALAERLDPDPAHSRHVALLCDQLFTDLQPVFDLGETERELLAYAARLHDIGLSIAEKAHHKLGAYLVQNAKLQGFWPKESDVISQVVRFHRGKAPRKSKDELHARLAPWHQQVVEKLAAIVRVADALDRSRRKAVRTVAIQAEEGGYRLVVRGKGDLTPELESLKLKGRLLYELLEQPVRMVIER
nr:Ppx/GppA phosphatase family protein [uncultured Holophaga sp.]